MRFISRYGLFLSVFLLLSTVVYAVPARPGQRRDLTLIDGTVVSARLVGDEHGHYWLADDGKAYRSDGDIYVEVDLKSLQEKAQEQRKESNMRRAKRLNGNQPRKTPSPMIMHCTVESLTKRGSMRGVFKAPCMITSIIKARDCLCSPLMW